MGAAGPIQQFDPSQLMAGMMDAYGFSDATGKRLTIHYDTGYNIEDEIKKRISNTDDANAVIQALQDNGVDLSKNYGNSSDDLQNLDNRLNYIKNYVKSNRGDGRFDQGRYDSSIKNLARDIKTTSPTVGTPQFEDIAGLGGISDIKKINAIRTFQRQNPNSQIDFSNKDQLSQVFGVSKDQISDEDIKNIQGFTNSDQFRNYNNQQDIIDQGFQQQKDAQTQYAEAQKRINAPGYAQNFVDQQFAPALNQLNQYYQPQGMGTKVSQAGVETGDAEAGMGRSGYDRVATELGRQQGMAYERLNAQKTAAVGDLQKYIDMGNPADALRMGSQIGQQVQGYQDTAQQRLLAPYNQMFPMMQQSYQTQLMPYSIPNQQIKGPEWYDYALEGVSALAPIGAAALGRGK